MDLGLRGLNAVVAGASSGIGKAIAYQLAHEGANVAICSRSEEKVAQTLSEFTNLPIKAVGSAVDVTDSERFSGWLSKVAEELGGIDVFVANVSPMSPDWDKAIETDIRATVSGMEAALPWLLESKHGSIVYIGSMASVLGAPQLAAYGAAKAAMTHYMKSLARGLVKKGVRVNTVSPGDVIFEGGVWDQVRTADPDAFKKVLRRNPRGALGTPDEVARVVSFIASPAASLVNGAHLLVDGCSTPHVHF